MKKYTMLMLLIFGVGFAFLASFSYAGWMGGQSGVSPMTAGYISAISGEKPFEYSATRIIGTEVRNEQGDYLGRVTDLLIDPENGKIAFAVLSRGGVLGIPTRFAAVPFGALTPNPEKKAYLLDVSREKMASAPTFSRDQWPDVSNREWDKEIYTYYGQAPYWGESHE